MLVAIHQPNFFPWLGYFEKLARADVFIALDNVQFPKSGAGNWINRVRIINNNHPHWLSVPIVRTFHGYRSVQEIRIDNSTCWRDKLLNTIRHSYRRAAHFDSVFPLVSELIRNSADRLAEYNLKALRALIQKIGLDPSKIVLGSSLKVDGQATDLLIAMVQAVGGTAYLFGGGARKYQEDEKFSCAGVKLVYQNFQHPTYLQSNTSTFVAGLSIVDAFMNCGIQKTSSMIREGSSWRSKNYPRGWV